MMYAYNPTYKPKFAICVENNFIYTQNWSK